MNGGIFLLRGEDELVSGLMRISGIDGVHTFTSIVLTYGYAFEGH